VTALQDDDLCLRIVPAPHATEEDLAKLAIAAKLPRKPRLHSPLRDDELELRKVEPQPKVETAKQYADGPALAPPKHIPSTSPCRDRPAACRGTGSGDCADEQRRSTDGARPLSLGHEPQDADELRIRVLQVEAGRDRVASQLDQPRRGQVASTQVPRQDECASGRQTPQPAGYPRPEFGLVPGVAGEHDVPAVVGADRIGLE